MDKICAKCTYLDINYGGDCYGKYYCNKKYERHLATDTACSSYTKAYSRSSSTISNSIDFSNNKTSSNCYITTLLCGILKLSDSNYYINSLRNFRDNYLIKNNEYSKLLVEYDIVGPMICSKLLEDKQNRIISARIFYNYISPIVSLIEDKMYNDAIIRYIMMVDKLRNLYGIDRIITSKEITECNTELAGHGNYIKKIRIKL